MKSESNQFIDMVMNTEPLYQRMIRGATAFQLAMDSGRQCDEYYIDREKLNFEYINDVFNEHRKET